MCGALAGGLLLIDSRLPLGVAAAVPYILVVAATARLPSIRSSWLWAGVCSALLLMGFAVSPAEGVVWHAVLNRGLGLFVIWTTATLVILHKKSLREQARARADLGETQTNLATVQKVARLGSWVRDLSTGESHCSAEFCRLFGLDRPTVRIEEVFARVHPDDRVMVMETTDRALVDRTPFEAAFRVLLPDGTERNLVSRGTVNVDSSGRPVSTSGTVQDVTESRQIEAALESQRTLLKTLMEAWPDMVYVKDTECRFLAANAWTATAMGANDPDELIGRTDFDFHPNHLAQDFYAAEQNLIQTQEPILSREEQVIDPNGETMWLSSTKVPLVRDGQVVGLVGINRDITALRAAREQAELANRTKSQFLANMSHELRTPLNAIIGFSAIIKDQAMGPVGDDTYVEYGADINSAGQHLLQLINDILDLSKIESGRDQLREEAIDVVISLGSIMRLLRERADDSGLRLELQAPAQTPPLIADELKLKQIVVNLLSNAIKFTRRGGTVTLRVSADEQAGYVFEVVDDGIGIDPQNLPTALSVFGQIDGPLNRRRDGSGLGLPLTKALVELHGGIFEIESTLGVGTTARVLFPPDRVGADAPAVTVPVFS